MDKTQRPLGKPGFGTFGESSAVNSSSCFLFNFALIFTYSFLIYQGDDHEQLLRSWPDLPSACVPVFLSVLSEPHLCPSPASFSVGLCFLPDSCFVPQYAAAAPCASVLATPVPSQLAPSWPAPLPHDNFRKRRKYKIRPELYHFEIREQIKFERDEESLISPNGYTIKSRFDNVMEKTLTVWLTYNHTLLVMFRFGRM